MVNFVTLRNTGSNSEIFNHYRKFSPLDGSLLYEVPISGSEVVAETFNKANAARINLRNTSLFMRTKMLDKVILNLELNREKIIRMVIQETGKPKKLSEAEFETAVLFGKSLAGLARFEDGISIPSSNPRKTAIEKRIPFGVAGLIVSYNTPLPNYAWKVFPSFLAGNASILKPSQHTSGSAQLFTDAFCFSEMPADSLNLIHGDGVTGELLVKEDLDLLSFTGSYEVALKIKDLSSKKMRKNIFELGGNNCLIVCSSSNIDKAVEAIIDSAFSNAGQRCAAGSRLIVHKNVAEIIINKIRKEISKLSNSEDNDLQIGPLIDDLAVKRHQHFIDECLINQMKVEGPTSSREKTLSVNPAIIQEFKYEDELFQRELFSPLLRVAFFENREEAILLANNSRYQLTAAVWSEEMSEIDFFIRNLNAGTINVNGPTHGSEFQFPFGGIGYSGNGTKEAGKQCLDQYSHHQIVTNTIHD